jgi:hypothetical protein
MRKCGCFRKVFWNTPLLAAGIFIFNPDWHGLCGWLLHFTPKNQPQKIKN